MIIVQTASRLHFGLLSLPCGPRWPDRQGQETIPARQFGGVGLMVQSPGIELRIRPAKDWRAHGPLAERALALAHRFMNFIHSEDDDLSCRLRGLTPPAQEIILERCAPEHAGLGTGTQLGLAVARGLSLAWDGRLPAKDLCLRVDRAARSALGFHGFFHGGFLVEAGKNRDSEIAPLVVREHFPQDWRVVLAIPIGETGLSGIKETEAIEELLAHGIPMQHTEKMCRLVLLGLLPALKEDDIKSLGEALFDFNSLAGQPFAKFQGGPYASPRIAALIQFIRGQGIAGAGQSSWGPTVFAIVEDEARANDLAAKIRQTFSLPENEVLVTSACNEGARVKEMFEGE